MTKNIAIKAVFDFNRVEIENNEKLKEGFFLKELYGIFNKWTLKLKRMRIRGSLGFS